MSARLPKTLQNLNLFIVNNGVYTFQGLCISLKLPTLAAKLERYSAAGLQFEKAFYGQLEPLECEFTLASFESSGVRTAMLKDNNHGTLLVFRGTFSDKTVINQTRPVLANIRGLIYSDSPSEWTPGGKTADVFKVNVKMYELKVDNKEVYFLDNDNMVRRIDGVDYLKSRREAISF